MKSIFQTGVLMAALALISASCSASDNAVLRNGFSILHQRRQTIGDVTRLYIEGDQSSFVDIPPPDIDHCEPVPDLPPASSPQQPVAAATNHAFNLNETVKAASGAYQHRSEER